MLILAGWLLWLIALGMQALPASGLRFTNFTSTRQCESFTIPFSGQSLNSSQVPAFLSFIPINSTAISAPLVNPALVSDGVSVPSLPFRANSNFLASLDDSNGENLIFVSDLVRVTASDNTNCLPPVSTPDPPRRFSLATGVAQCQEMTLKYDTSVVSKAPIVRLYSPRGRSFILNSTSDNPSTGEAKYLVNFFRGREVVFLMQSGDNIRETSPVITVGGDAASNKGCLRGLNDTTTSSDSTSSTPNDNTDTDDSIVGSNGNASSSTSIPSRSVIIGSAAGGGVVVLIGLAMILFVIRDRRRRRKANAESMDSPDIEKPESEKNFVISRPYSPPEEKSETKSNGMVSNPAYARSSSLLTPVNSKHQRGSLASWAQATPEDQIFPARSPVSPTRVVVHSPLSANHDSLEFSDIEGMLNLAAMQAESNPSRKNSQATILSNYPTVAVPDSSLLAPHNNRFHRREPSDVPGGPDSMAFSSYSVNPFDSRHPSIAITPSILEKNLRTSLADGNVGLPSSPRDVRGVGNGRRLSRISGRSSSDWYGIAR